MTVHVTIAIDETTKADLDAWALVRGVELDHVLSEAVIAYVEDNHRDIAMGVAKGRAALAAGDVVDHDDAVAEFAKVRAEWLSRA